MTIPRSLAVGSLALIALTGASLPALGAPPPAAPLSSAPGPAAGLPPPPASPGSPASPAPASPGAAAASSGPADASAQPAETPASVRRVSLENAMKMALERNTTAATAAAEIRRAEALVEQARASSLPTVSGVATYTRLDSDRTFATTGAVIAPANSFNASLFVNVPIIHPRNWATLRHAEDNIDIARASMKDVRRQVATVTARAYLAVLVQRRLVEVNESARDTAKLHYEYSHQRYAGGVGNRIDEVRAAQELSTDIATVESAKTSLARAQEALGVLAGSGTPLDVDADMVLPTPPALGAALDEASRRSDVRAVHVRREAAERVSKDNWTEYSPYLAGVGQAFYQNPASLTFPTTGWQAQLILTIPLYDGGLRYGLGKEREALVDEANVALEGALRQAKSEVRVAFEAMRRADDALLAAREASRLAREALELANLSYRAGATTNLEVVDAERRARDADIQSAIAEDGARQGRLELLSASGRLPPS